MERQASTFNDLDARQQPLALQGETVDLSSTKYQSQNHEMPRDSWKHTTSSSNVVCIRLDADQAHDLPPKLSQASERTQEVFYGPQNFAGPIHIASGVASDHSLLFPALRHLVVRGVEHVQQLSIYSTTAQGAAANSLLLSFVAALQKRHDMMVQGHAREPAPVLHLLTFVGCQPPPGFIPELIEAKFLSRLRKLTRRLVWEEEKATWRYSLDLSQPDEQNCAICLSGWGQSRSHGYTYAAR